MIYLHRKATCGQCWQLHAVMSCFDMGKGKQVKNEQQTPREVINNYDKLNTRSPFMLARRYLQRNDF